MEGTMDVHLMKNFQTVKRHACAAIVTETYHSDFSKVHRIYDIGVNLNIDSAL